MHAGELDPCQKLAPELVAGGGAVVGVRDEVEQAGARAVQAELGGGVVGHGQRVAGEVTAPDAGAALAGLAGDLVESAAGDAEGDGGEQRDDDAEHGHPPQRAVGPGLADEGADVVGVDGEALGGHVVAAGAAQPDDVPRVLDGDVVGADERQACTGSPSAPRGQRAPTPIHRRAGSC